MEQNFQGTAVSSVLDEEELVDEPSAVPNAGHTARAMTGIPRPQPENDPFSAVAFWSRKLALQSSDFSAMVERGLQEMLKETRDVKEKLQGFETTVDSFSKETAECEIKRAHAFFEQSTALQRGIETISDVRRATEAKLGALDASIGEMRALISQQTVLIKGQGLLIQNLSLMLEKVHRSQAQASHEVRMHEPSPPQTEIISSTKPNFVASLSNIPVQRKRSCDDTEVEENNAASRDKTENDKPKLSKTRRIFEDDEEWTWAGTQ
ncbi:hypothetical protein SAICODRAFT_8218 [Saitoella complicata NRRL Y-17804]|uniref:Uncharacterized protein n=1 Tax=Saitoella complicata (strain BCRC 22490 / CBS 7301 / JCM 7358 / NBRC 10748 / NRRL Y-17804) TaxID=698492 RepID=A0A0E9NCJ1_SAICN|nr:uncharacterized protein SAICODRAFT_8218 [Saitoella complicata NRRL Y-17804]ODQ52400.1 hypothetical protein SAICODRAFT_8218 [Saitoella complicata NRRL Y-17804]GAO47587.1 hypothetical protein G7K_1789-t1 [Saitoella complicata NRRL Y-17804]